ncbi:MAG TPA: AraC family transcriptional regulator [Puia sp.]|nr:AraC family transcriptional regulator [Puia sp.]
MITKRRDIATLQEIRQFLENNFTKDVPVRSICREFGFNRTKLQEGFNQLFNITVHAFISQMRMNKARGLLKETDESVKLIALECGYKKLSSFTRVFTRWHGMSPTRYRALSAAKEKLSEKADGSVN